MNISNIITTASRGLGVTKHFIKCKSPQILLVAGIGAVVGGVITACKATRKVDTIKKETEEFIDICETSVGKECEDGSVYTEEDKTVDIKNEKFLTVMRSVRAYVVPTLLVAGGIVSIIFSHKIMKDRLDGMMAAYTMLTNAYACYRRRVAEKYGADAEFDIYHGKGVGTDLDDGLGNRIIIDKECANDPTITASPYTFIFDARNPYWSNSNALNAAFLIRTRNMLNQRLWTKGSLYLDDVLEAFGFEDDYRDVPKLRKMIRVCGWVDSMDDGAIDLGRVAEDFIRAAAKSELDSQEPLEIIIDFNCSGDILHRPWPTKTMNKIYKMN